MRFYLLLFIVSLGLFGGLSCASRFGATADYKSHLSEKKNFSSRRTVLLFLIDGLPVSTLKSQLMRGHLPHLKNYFIQSGNEFSIARTGFPSVTYPSVAALLTERPLDQHGIYGNKMFRNNEHYDFESPSDFEELDKLTLSQNIFSRLNKKNLNSVSFSFTFNQAATAHIGNSDLTSGLAIRTQDYAYTDAKMLEGLEILLEEVKPDRWPAFIYIHLVGVDFLSHQFGPDSSLVTAYLQSLDKKLKPIFKLLTQAEKNQRHQVVSLLTADHGYDKRIHKVISIKSVVPAEALPSVLNESRYLSFRFPTHWSSQQKMQYAQNLKQNFSIDIIAYRENQSVQLISKKLQTQIFYGASTCDESTFAISIGVDSPTKACPQHIADGQNQLFYPYFVTHVSQYFQSSDHPDIVIIPQPGISFNPHERGQHGGPTPAEVFVPLLIRNGHVPPRSSVIPLSDILQFL